MHGLRCRRHAGRGHFRLASVRRPRRQHPDTCCRDAVANRIAVFISHIRTGPLILRHARQYQLEEGIFHYVDWAAWPVFRRDRSRMPVSKSSNGKPGRQTFPPRRIISSVTSTARAGIQ